MRRTYPALFLLLVGLLLTHGATGQAKLNLRLKRELDSIEVVDQRYRLLLMPGPDLYKRLDSIAQARHMPPEKVYPYLADLMVAQDSANIKRIAQIIARYGYPGKSLVGEPTNGVAMLVIQHSTRIPRYLPLVEQAARHGEIPFRLYALMLDRHLMHQGKAQVYGTQGRVLHVPNARTGKTASVEFIWPIQDAAHVNERRRKAGFDSTVEDNARRLNIVYKPMPLAEALRLQRAAAAAAKP